MESSKCHNHKVRGGWSPLLSHDVKVRGGNHCMNRGVVVHVLVCAGCGFNYLVQGLKKQFGESFVKKFQRRVLVSTMGGDPVTMEPTVLIMDEEVRIILEETGLLSFFKSFKAEVSSLPNEGEIIHREKMNQVNQLTRFIRDKETFYWLDLGITRESLPKPWDRVVMVLMKYLTLEVGPSKGFSKVSGTSISKAQLLLGPIQASSNADSGDSNSEAEDDSGSEEKLSRAKFPKDKGSRKRKTPMVLSSSLAKYSQRSTRLQQKSLGTPSLLDVADSSEEEKILVEPSSSSGKNCLQKSPTTTLSGKEASPRTPLVNEDLRSHLRVLNSLGTSLTSTCACVNLLTLEIRNYLKEVLIILKEEKNEKV
eukprot:Gb_27292 [translate_table: standard]